MLVINIKKMIMKRVILFAASAVTLFSCKPEIGEPNADFRYTVIRNGEEVVPDVVYAGESVTFESTGSGDYFVVYPGVPGYRYEDRTLDPSIASADSNIVSSKGVGFPLSKRDGKYSFTFKYTNNGTCNLAFVASNISKDGKTVKTAVNTEYKLTVRDSVGDLTSVVFYEPSGIKVVREGNVFKLMVDYGKKVTNAYYAFSAGNATVSRDGKVLVPFKGVIEDEVDLSSPVFYDVTAPDGTKYKYEFRVVQRDYVKSSANKLTDIAIAGKTYLPTDNTLAIKYPSRATDAAVAFKISSKAKVKLSGVAEKTTYTVADLLASSKSFKVVSESGVESEPYTFTITESSLSFLPLSFAGASGFPLTVDNTAKSIQFSLASSYDVSKLLPLFTLSDYTSVSFEKNGSFVGYKPQVDTVNFSSPVNFKFVNGKDTVVYTIKSL